MARIPSKVKHQNNMKHMEHNKNKQNPYLAILTDQDY